MNRIFTFIFVVVGGALLYRFRYQIISNLLGNKWFSKALVRVSLGIPSVRRVFTSQMFR